MCGATKITSSKYKAFRCAKCHVQHLINSSTIIATGYSPFRPTIGGEGAKIELAKPVPKAPADKASKEVKTGDDAMPPPSTGAGTTDDEKFKEAVKKAEAEAGGVPKDKIFKIKWDDEK